MEYMATLRSRFGFVANAEQYRAELSRLRRGTKTIHALNLEVRRLVNKAFPGSWSRSTEVYARDAFLRALENEELRNRILMTMPPPETLAAAYELAVRAYAVTGDTTKTEDARNRPYRARAVGSEGETPLLERDEAEHQAVVALQRQVGALQAAMEKLASSNASQQPAAASTGDSREPPARTNTTVRSTIICFYCHQPGHLFRNCPKRKTTKPSESSAHAKVLSTTKRHQVSVYLPIRYQQKEYRALLDTGCDISVLSSNILPDLSYQECSQRMTAANSSSIPIQGSTTVEFVVEGKPMTYRFLVSNAIDEIILGSDFLADYQCVWEFANSRLTITTELESFAVSLRTGHRRECVRRLYASSTVEVPPYSQQDIGARTVWSTLPPATGWLVEPSELRPGVLLARTLLSDDTTGAQLRILNSTPTACLVSEGELLGVAEPVDAGGSATTIADRTTTGNESSTVQQSQPTTGKEHVQYLIDALPAELTAEQKHAATKFIEGYSHAFSKTATDLGRNRMVPHRIDTGSHPPVRQPLRRQPYAHLPEIEKNVNELLKAKVIEPAQSCYNSNVLLVRKKDGTMRFCVDYRKLNSNTTKISYPLPRIDTCLESLGGAQYFSTLDLRSGYWQTEIAEEDRDKTAFSTRSGQYRFTVLSMGLANAPAQFQRLMDMVLIGLNFETCLIYLDDIICFSRTFDEHLTRLSAIFDRLVDSNLKLSAKKCHLFQPEVDFLGHVVSRQGIAVSPDKIRAVLHWPTPQNVHEVRSFLGLAGYYRKYVYRYADIAKPLQILTSKDAPFIWGDAQEEAFCNLKLRLTSAPILSSPIDDGMYILDTDASQIGLGAVLQQVQDDKVKVIAYGSRNLTRAEQNYNTTRRELLAVVYGLKQFRQFLLGRHFLLRVDHSALTYLRKTPEVMGQAARWLEFIEEYDFSIRHRAGSAHSNCDALSRKPVSVGNIDNRHGDREVLSEFGYYEQPTWALETASAPVGQPTNEPPAGQTFTTVQSSTTDDLIKFPTAGGYMVDSSPTISNHRQPFNRSVHLCLPIDHQPPTSTTGIDNRQPASEVVGRSTGRVRQQSAIELLPVGKTSTGDRSLSTDVSQPPVYCTLNHRQPALVRQRHERTDTDVLTATESCRPTTTVRPPPTLSSEAECRATTVTSSDRSSTNVAVATTATAEQQPAVKSSTGNDTHHQRYHRTASLEPTTVTGRLPATTAVEREPPYEPASSSSIVIESTAIENASCNRVAYAVRQPDNAAPVIAVRQVPPQPSTTTTERRHRSRCVGSEVGSNLKVGSVPLPSVDCRELTPETIREEQRREGTLNLFVEALEKHTGQPSWSMVQYVSEEARVLHGQFDSLKMENGILHREFYSAHGSVLRLQIVLPSSLRQLFLQTLHDTGGNVGTTHLGIKKTVEHVQQRAYWPTWRTDTERYCRRCVVCQSVQHGVAPKHGRLQLYEPTSVGERLHIDLTGPHPMSRQGSVYILTAIDAYSRFLWCVPIKNKQAVTVAAALVDHVLIPYGSYNYLVSDQGGEFCNEVLDSISRLMDIRKIRTTAFRPAANGRCERVHRTINGLLAKLVQENQRDWQDRLIPVTASYNAAYHESLSYSPYYIMHGREYRTPLDLSMGIGDRAYGNCTIDYVDELQERLKTAYRDVNERMQTNTQRMKLRYDGKVKTTTLKTDQFAMFYVPQRKVGRNQKWRRLCRVVQVVRRLNDVLYCIKVSPKATPITAHIDRLRVFEGELPEPWLTYVSQRDKHVVERPPDATATTTEQPATTGEHTGNVTSPAEQPPNADLCNNTTTGRAVLPSIVNQPVTTGMPPTEAAQSITAVTPDSSTIDRPCDKQKTTGVSLSAADLKPTTTIISNTAPTLKRSGRTRTKPFRFREVKLNSRIDILRQRMEKRKVVRRDRQGGPYPCSFCGRAPFRTTTGLRGHVITEHDMNCDWLGVPRAFVDDAERNRVQAAIHRGRRHDRTPATARKRPAATVQTVETTEVDAPALRMIRLEPSTSSESVNVDFGDVAETLGLDRDGWPATPETVNPTIQQEQELVPSTSRAVPTVAAETTTVSTTDMSANAVWSAEERLVLVELALQWSTHMQRSMVAELAAFVDDFDRYGPDSPQVQARMPAFRLIAGLHQPAAIGWSSPLTSAVVGKRPGPPAAAEGISSSSTPAQPRDDSPPATAESVGLTSSAVRADAKQQPATTDWEQRQPPPNDIVGQTGPPAAAEGVGVSLAPTYNRSEPPPVTTGSTTSWPAETSTVVSAGAFVAILSPLREQLDTSPISVSSVYDTMSDVEPSD
jgi:transposase InsO family protein